MKTIIYLIGNAMPLRKNIVYDKLNEIAQVKNEKTILSVSGEAEAEQLSTENYLKDVTKVYSSQYVRAIATAKYLAEANKLEIIVTDQLGEIKIGFLGNLDGIDFHQRRIKDFNFSLNGGESINQAKENVESLIQEIIAAKNDEKVALFSHQMAITAALSTWCEVGYSLENKLVLSYNDEVIADENWDYPAVFELVFDNSELQKVTKLQ